jgi:hypothetical protein
VTVCGANAAPRTPYAFGAAFSVGGVGVFLDHGAGAVRRCDHRAQPVLMRPYFAIDVRRVGAPAKRIIDHQERLIDAPGHAIY